MWQTQGKGRGHNGGEKRSLPAGLRSFGVLKVPAAKLAAARRPVKPKVYGRIGNLEVRLAQTRSDVRQAQHLRYQVFYEEMSAEPSRLARFRRRDEDAYDAICDHLLVVDLDQTARRLRHGRPVLPKVVGTYRVLRQDVAERQLGFYTGSEFDIAPLIRAKSPRYRFMELGRSCVLAPYRGKRSVELLWHGLWTYVREHKIDVMIGCASFEGTDPKAHAMALSYLHHHARAPAEWLCQARPGLGVSMNMMPASELDAKAALKAMPPLIKGYLRLGAYIGDGAVIDRQFGTTDVLIILPVEKIDPRYFEYYGLPDETKSRVAVDA
jgi:putative hemolysin